MSALETLASRLTLPYRRGAEFAAVALGPDVAGVTQVPFYDFSDYRARWGEDPSEPTYIIAPRGDVGGDDLDLTVGYTLESPQTVMLTIPRATRAGTGFALPLPLGASAALRLTTLSVAPRLAISGNAAWEVVMLLGTIAKLVWILGQEKDALARVRQDVRSTRFVRSAFGGGLDALGKDMRVPRFPPRPYSPDEATVALWHLDELPNGGPVTIVADQATPAHAGTVAAAIAGAPGKYGTAFAFSAAGSAITVAPSADFDIPANGDATIEAFVRVNVPSDATPRAILARRASETAAGSNIPGWSLCAVNARGFNANALFALCDGTREVRLFADLSLADGKYHHVAGMVDRSRARARLFVDGVQQATAPTEGFGAIAPPDAVRLGSTVGGNNFSGAIDEVRISRVARSTFHPALGEDDDAYRARLRIFRRWLEPNPAAIIDMINQAAPLPVDPAPFVLVEANRLTQVAETAVRIVPTTIAPGGAIAVDGTTPRDETVAGTPTDDAGFDPALDLIAYANAGVDASGDPGGARMQAGTGQLLDALATRLAAVPTPGNVILEHSFDPSGPTPLHSVGRALRLSHSSLSAGALAAWAHRSGFAYVRNLGPDIAVAVPSGERLAIRSAPAATPHVDVGAAFDLTVAPALPLAGNFVWTIITPGPARAHLVAHSADPPTLATPVASRPRVRLVTDAPGDLAVRVEYARSGLTRSGTLTLRIDPTSVADGHAMDAVDNPDPDLAAIAGNPDPDFDPAYLVTHPANPAIDFGVDPNNAKMQVVARDALDALVELLARRAIAGRLRVMQAFVPGAPGIEGVGRKLVVGHETLDAGVLAALAVRFFDYVARAGGSVTAVMRTDSWIEIGDAATTAPLPGEIVLGTPLKLGVVPGTLPPGSYNWSTRAIGAGAGSFDTVLRPTAQFTPGQPGPLMLALTYVPSDPSRAAPYTFDIRLKPALDTPGTTIPKAQYDIIMNVLDAFHPIGVEVRTDDIRKHVREIEQDPTKAFPAYSFPNFRL